MMNTSPSKDLERRHKFKQTIGNGDGRRARQEANLQIRKHKRDENIRKRRVIGGPVIGGRVAGGGGSSSNMPFPQILHILKSPAIAGPHNTLLATTELQQVLSTNNTEQQREEFGRAVKDSGVLSAVIQNLGDPNYELKYHSTLVLCNMASSIYADAVVDAEAIEPLIQLLGHGEPELAGNAVWCLSNIAGESVQFRDYILSFEPINSILLNIKYCRSVPVLGSMVWGLYNIFRTNPRPTLELDELGRIIETIVKDVLFNFMIGSDENDANVIVTDALSILSSITDNKKELIQKLIGHKVLDPIKGILNGSKFTSENLLLSAIRVVGNITNGTDKQTQYAIDAGILDVVGRILDDPSGNSKFILKEACWVVSNIAAGTESQVEAIIKVPRLVSHLITLSRDARWPVRKEALFALSNIFVMGNDEQVLSVIQREGLRPMAEVLGVGNSDTALLLAVLDGIKAVMVLGTNRGLEYTYGRLLDEYGALAYLDELQLHENVSVYNAVCEIVSTYFSDEDEQEDENLAPATAENGTFAFAEPSVPAPKRLFSELSSPIQLQPPQFNGRISNRG